uniref:Conserved oligomeric Golgi complex subunit 8 n=1 Tax=Aceria tosichella TaxID=561515 RepID=A0A6G1S9Y3_9ACAR
MTPSDLAENCARFDTIAKCSDKCDHIDKQLTHIEGLISSVNDDHLGKLIENASQLKSNLQQSKPLRSREYHALREHLPGLEAIINIPTKLCQYVNDPDHYNEALGLFEVIHHLDQEHSQTAPILRDIHEQARKYHSQLIVNLCNRLDELEESSQQELSNLVNQLIRCGGFSSRDLRLRFLQARDHWFNNECESRTDSFDDLTSFFCRGLPKIFEEYKFIFSDSATLANSKLVAISSQKSPIHDKNDQVKEDGAIINSWLLLKTSTFILSLEMHLEALEESRSLTPSMLSDTMEKCFKLTDWLASIGFDFSSQLKPIFAKSVIEEVKFNVQSATEQFETDFTKLISKSIESLLLPIDDKILRISNMRPEEQIPKSIEHYPIFKIYCLYMIDSMRWVQATKTMISPLSLCLDVYAALNGSLTRVMKALAVVLNTDNNTNHPILSKIAVSFLTEAVPFIANYCELIFPEKVMLNAIGLTRTEFKNLCLNEPEKVRNFRLDLRQIGQPIRGTMPALMQALES